MGGEQQPDYFCLYLSYFCCIDATITIIVGFLLLAVAAILCLIPPIGVIAGVIVAFISLLFLIDGFLTCIGAGCCYTKGSAKHEKNVIIADV